MRSSKLSTNIFQPIVAAIQSALCTRSAQTPLSPNQATAKGESDSDVSNGLESIINNLDNLEISSTRSDRNEESGNLGLDTGLRLTVERRAFHIEAAAKPQDAHVVFESLWATIKQMGDKRTENATNAAYLRRALTNGAGATGKENTPTFSFAPSFRRDLGKVYVPTFRQHITKGMPAREFSTSAANSQSSPKARKVSDIESMAEMRFTAELNRTARSTEKGLSQTKYETPLVFSPSELDVFVTSEWAAHMERVYRHRLEEISQLMKEERRLRSLDSSGGNGAEILMDEVTVTPLDEAAARTLSIDEIQERLRQLGQPCPDPASPEMSLLAAAGLRHEKRLYNWLLARSERLKASGDDSFHVIDLAQLFSAAARAPMKQSRLRHPTSTQGNLEAGLTFAEILKMIMYSGYSQSSLQDPLQFAEVIARTRRSAVFHERGASAGSRMRGLTFGERVALSREAIRSGVNVIYQPLMHWSVSEMDEDLRHEEESSKNQMSQLFPQACGESTVFIKGFPDFLVRINSSESVIAKKAEFLNIDDIEESLAASTSIASSSVDGFAYEVWDTKLARTPKPSAIIQIVQYAMMVEESTGVQVPNGVIALGNETFYRFPIADFVPLVRLLQRRFCAFLRSFDPNYIPIPPVSVQQQGRYTEFAAKTFEMEDHISRINRLHSTKIKPLEEIGIKKARIVAAFTLLFCPKSSVYLSNFLISKIERLNPVVASLLRQRVGYWEKKAPRFKESHEYAEVDNTSLLEKHFLADSADAGIEYNEEEWTTCFDDLLDDGLMDANLISKHFFPSHSPASRFARKFFKDELAAIVKSSSSAMSAPPVNIPGFSWLPVGEALYIFMRLDIDPKSPKELLMEFLESRFGVPEEPVKSQAGTGFLDISIGSVNSSIFEESLATSAPKAAPGDLDELARQLDDLSISFGSLMKSRIDEESPQKAIGNSKIVHEIKEPIVCEEVEEVNTSLSLSEFEASSDLSRAEDMIDYFKQVLKLLSTKTMQQASLQLIDTVSSNCNEVYELLSSNDVDGVRKSIEEIEKEIYEGEQHDEFKEIGATSSDDILENFASTPNKKENSPDSKFTSKAVCAPPFSLLPPIVSSVAISGLPRLPKGDNGDLYFDIEGYPNFDFRYDNLPSNEKGSSFAQPEMDSKDSIQESRQDLVVPGKTVEDQSPFLNKPIGLEYLFGLSYWASVDDSPESDRRLEFVDWWAHNHAEERRMFESFIDFVLERLSQYPDMHIYHYASYEVTALKRLAQRYCTREAELDSLLQQGVFIDMYPLCTQSVLVGQPRSSLKNIEKLLYGAPKCAISADPGDSDFTPILRPRSGDVTNAMGSVIVYERWLREGGSYRNLLQRDALFSEQAETANTAANYSFEEDVSRGSSASTNWRSFKELQEIRNYNKEDCDNLLFLTEWIRSIQMKLPNSFQPSAFNPRTPKSPTKGSVRKRATKKVLSAPLNSIQPISDSLQSIDTIKARLEETFDKINIGVQTNARETDTPSNFTGATYNSQEEFKLESVQSSNSALKVSGDHIDFRSMLDDKEVRSEQSNCEQAETTKIEQRELPSDESSNVVFIDTSFFDIPETNTDDNIIQPPQGSRTEPKNSTFYGRKFIKRYSHAARLEKALRIVSGFLEPGKLDLGLSESAIEIESNEVGDEEKLAESILSHGHNELQLPMDSPDKYPDSISPTQRSDRLRQALSLVACSGEVHSEALEFGPSSQSMINSRDKNLASFAEVASLSPWRSLSRERACALLRSVLPVLYSREHVQVTDKRSLTQEDMEKIREDARESKEMLKKLNSILHELHDSSRYFERMPQMHSQKIYASSIIPAIALQLGDLVSHYKRENKPLWWNLYALQHLTEEELLAEQSVIAGLLLISHPTNLADIGVKPISVRYRLSLNQSLPSALLSNSRIALSCRIIGLPSVSCSVKSIQFELPDNISQKGIEDSLSFTDAQRLGCKFAQVELSFSVTAQERLADHCFSSPEFDQSKGMSSIFPPCVHLCPFEMVDTSSLEAGILDVSDRFLNAIVDDMTQILIQRRASLSNQRYLWASEKAISPLLFSFLLRLPPWLNRSPILIGSNNSESKQPSSIELVHLMESLVNLDQVHTKHVKDQSSLRSPAPVLIVQGPPGTGKTSLTSKAVHMLLARNPNARVGVISNGHIAIDHFLHNLVQLDFQNIRRNGSRANLLILKGGSVVSGDLKPYCMTKPEFMAATGFSSSTSRRKEVGKIDTEIKREMKPKYVRELSPKELWSTLEGLNAFKPEGNIKSHNSSNHSQELMRSPNVVAGTAWLFAHVGAPGRGMAGIETFEVDASYDDGLDWLIVEEAGQLSLAHLVASLSSFGKRTIKGLLLLGDDRQLQVPLRGNDHPGESATSALGFAMKSPLIPISSLSDKAALESPSRNANKTVSLNEQSAVVPPHKGIFLPVSFRMPSHICASISRAFYEAQLIPKDSSAMADFSSDFELIHTNELKEMPPGVMELPFIVDPLDFQHPGFSRERDRRLFSFPSSGFCWVPVDHTGELSLGVRSSEEEAWAAAFSILEIWSTRQLKIKFQQQEALRPIVPSDVLVVAPYNAQVQTLRRIFDTIAQYLADGGLSNEAFTNEACYIQLELFSKYIQQNGLSPFHLDKVRIGTVDKFQGQQAPIVILSMAVGSPSTFAVTAGSYDVGADNSPLEYIPQRDLTFIMDRARLNVALSRSQCVAIIISSPSLLLNPAYTVEQFTQQAFFASVCFSPNFRKRESKLQNK